MHLPAAVLSLLVPAAVQALATTRSPPCSAPAPEQQFLNVLHDFRAQEANVSANALVERAQAQVKTFIHIIAIDRSYNGGYVDVCFLSSLSPKHKAAANNLCLRNLGINYQQPNEYAQQ